LRPRRTTRAAVKAGALACATATVGALSLAGPAEARNANIGAAKKRLHVRAGGQVHVIGAVRPGGAGVIAALQVRRRGAWRTIDRDRTAASGRYVLRDRARVPMSAPARVRSRGVTRRVGRVNVYRWAYASWYGPGLYGNPLGCGGTLYPGRLGVAHKSLPCGSKVTLRHRGRNVRVRVIDRGPYVGGREFDLTEATAQRLRFHGHGSILVTR
jgi:peptidoglycan lytic transglycosylase